MLFGRIRLKLLAAVMMLLDDIGAKLLPMVSRPRVRGDDEW